MTTANTFECLPSEILRKVAMYAEHPYRSWFLLSMVSKTTQRLLGDYHTVHRYKFAIIDPCEQRTYCDYTRYVGYLANPESIGDGCCIEATDADDRTVFIKMSEAGMSVHTPRLICPVTLWSTEASAASMRLRNVPYCKLSGYDGGVLWTRQYVADIYTAEALKEVLYSDLPSLRLSLPAAE